MQLKTKTLRQICVKNKSATYLLNHLQLIRRVIEQSIERVPFATHSNIFVMRRDLIQHRSMIQISLSFLRKKKKKEHTEPFTLFYAEPPPKTVAGFIGLPAQRPRKSIHSPVDESVLGNGELMRPISVKLPPYSSSGYSPRSI